MTRAALEARKRRLAAAWRRLPPDVLTTIRAHVNWILLVRRTEPSADEVINAMASLTADEFQQLQQELGAIRNRLRATVARGPKPVEPGLLAAIDLLLPRRGDNGGSGRPTPVAAAEGGA